MEDEDVLERLADASGVSVDFSALQRARQDASLDLESLRLDYEGLDIDDEVGLAVIGSIGRLERTQGSDLDILIVSERPASDAIIQRTDALIAERAQDLGFELSNPDGHPKFKNYQPSVLASEIGEDADSNTAMTVRMCLMLESVAVAGETVVASCKNALMDTYLSKNSLRDSVPPRFLLNETMRFWRTMAVDFEGKMRRRADQGWALRNGKLRTVRKMLYASALLPVLECHRLNADEMRRYLTTQFEIAPADRVALSFLEYGMADDGARALSAYCDFLQILDEPSQRSELDRMAKDSRGNSLLWQRVRQSGTLFHDSLTALLYDSALGATTREYAVL